MQSINQSKLIFSCNSELVQQKKLLQGENNNVVTILQEGSQPYILNDPDWHPLWKSNITYTIHIFL